MSVYQFKLPDIGEGISEGTVAKWYVKPGDTLKEDDDLLEIENDKSVEEIPAPVSGTIKRILVEEGETAEVGQGLVEFEVAGDELPAGVQEESPEMTEESAPEESVEQTPAAPASKTAPVHAEEAENAAAVLEKPDHSLPVLAMPAVRSYARQQGVDLKQINGTGNHGHVTRADVDVFLKRGATAAPAPEKAVDKEPVSVPAAAGEWSETREKMSGIRKATAKAMVRSKSEIPHVTVFDDVVVDKLWAHRKKYKEVAAKREVRLTFLAYIVKALTVILHEYPIFNSKVDMEKQEIVYRDYINIGVATDTDRGLLVPNIKHADEKSLFALARQISANTNKAQEGKLSADDMKYSSMSITNIGSIGGGFFTPIINWPEVAILGVGRIKKEPIIVDDEAKAAYVMKLSLSFDHRVIDGATAQRALNRLNELLSNPELLLMEG
ncbi:dihydrolipoamide acetyltransferase component of pyruvate dehydrogenase complex [Liquorilactobacillus sucicola DSM 21376 = JCM 15457]|uniref:Dihydrolipoamide acetyltransferase component of pyruvate dehydrogenase complex n=1 Tax=Liquorilactobacillus sucicola DSM 21376 = JCM 15457 TaxID=1423806 RepID=A0A023CZP6_9LACO|nr:dihydrolipoamide acetyltransferase family protein [Liquorilactobacillus sucicola]KRN06784.1 dihydrolipoyllysine-residue acetyltransferase component of pyruvate dehydrogenase complex [Liquorilactobacillus sucicola DSM 21376 = JCM 15457]GAJ27061.1 dihydrolipoamide acetyltransferase component of pyruvate dehydrogenase complex [Liquorilactobacillus sucicola DSM 21376 = JCM 15457]